MVPKDPTIPLVIRNGSLLESEVSQGQSIHGWWAGTKKAGEQSGGQKQEPTHNCSGLGRRRLFSAAGTRGTCRM